MKIKINEDLELKQVQVNERKEMFNLIDENRPSSVNGCPGWTL
jgi:hypothetical protein